jgi:hypothetical protein
MDRFEQTLQRPPWILHMNDRELRGRFPGWAAASLGILLLAFGSILMPAGDGGGTPSCGSSHPGETAQLYAPGIVTFASLAICSQQRSARPVSVR